MSLVLDDLPRDPDRLLQQLQQMTEIIAAQNASFLLLHAKHDAVLVERDAAQAEIEKLRLLIRQLQRGQFGRRSEKLDPDQLQLGLEDLEQLRVRPRRGSIFQGAGSNLSTRARVG